MTTSTDRTQYRALVAEIAAKARATLPEAVNGRVESAVRLVLAHDVTPQADGSIEVGSSSDPLKTYRLVGATCTCQDFERGQAPDGWCQHRIAAGIAKRVQELLPQSPPVETEPSAGPVLQGTPAVPPAQPEAPASVNVRVTIGGREVRWTLRDSDEARLAVRLEALLARYPVQVPASPPAPTQGQGDTPQCPAHGAKKPSTKGKGYYCPHKLPDGTWCKA